MTAQVVQNGAGPLISMKRRNEMQQFWEQHSAEGNIKEMMLDDSDAVEMVGQEDTREILDMLPDFTGARVLELGAGIGRFTSELGKKAKSVVAVDFMQKFVNRNKELNGHMTNIQFLQADATKLQQPQESLEIVFSNWLLMYLDDEEVYNLFTNILRWLKPGGYLFFRESCFHRSGSKSRQFNPTNYRSPAQYNSLYQRVSIQVQNNSGSYGLEVVMSRSVQTYVKHKNNRNQVCWLLQKVHQDTKIHKGFKSFQEFLDNQQYSRNGILRYEKIFGHNFISPGGKETTEDFLIMLDLKSGDYVLDVGCGIGGNAFYMAEKYGAHVLGIDLSANMIAIGLERANEIKDRRVQLEIGDATKRQFAEESYDVITSRDVIVHIKDKACLFSKFLSWLKPGGKLLITSYCCGEGTWSEQFEKYVLQRSLHLATVSQFGKMLEEAGFVKVRAEDRTKQFTEILKTELSRTRNIKDQFIKDCSQEDYDAIVTGWEDKITSCAQGDLTWGLFYAEKPITLQ